MTENNENEMLEVLTKIVDFPKDFNINNPADVKKLLNITYNILCNNERESDISLALMDCIDNILNNDVDSKCQHTIDDNESTGECSCKEFGEHLSVAEAARRASINRLLGLEENPKLIRQLNLHYDDLPRTAKHFLSFRCVCPRGGLRG